MTIRSAVIAVLGLLLLPSVATAQTFDEDRIRELVLETIRQNPEIVMEAVALLQQREAERETETQARTLAEQRDLIENDPNAPVLGNEDGDVTVVVFFDYNCPYCRRAKPEIEALLEKDPNVRLVAREWPVLGDDSVFAARAALAARAQGRYEDFHWALMGMDGRAEEAAIMEVAEEIGITSEQLRYDMTAPEIDAHIATSMRLTQALGFRGTPSFVIGDVLVPGLVDAARLKELVEGARREQE